MFSGTQFSIYPMTGDFVPVIMDSLAALDAYGSQIRRDTDDLSTLLVGPPRIVVQAMRDAFVGAARRGVHVVLSGTLSRGCPGESDDPICTAPPTPALRPGEDPARDSAARFDPGPLAGIPVSAQISLYPLGTDAHMARIGACIGFPESCRRLRPIEAFLLEADRRCRDRVRGDRARLHRLRAAARARGPDPHGIGAQPVRFVTPRRLAHASLSLGDIA